MDYERFERMTNEEAVEHLQHYLEIEKRAIEGVTAIATREGIVFNYKLETLPSVLEWFISKATFIKVPVPETEPDWIRKAHPDGITEFTQDSKFQILRASFYLGQCFVNDFKDLSWGIGKPGYMHKNMPVIRGFTNQKELASMVVANNIFKGILANNKPISFIRSVVEQWVSYAS